MLEINRKSLFRLLLAPLVIGLLLASVCLHLETGTARPKTQTQIIKDITPREAYTLIMKNKDNPDFVILDVRTPREFAEGHIQNAVNLDYYSETFRDDLDSLDKNKTYLIYCRSARRSGKALDIMKALNFGKVYNMLGGTIQWKTEGLPTTN